MKDLAAGRLDVVVVGSGLMSLGVAGITLVREPWQLFVAFAVMIPGWAAMGGAAINTLIERKGAKTGLIVTKGTRDVLTIGREIRYELYDLNLELPKPLVPRHLRFDVPERVAADGSGGAAQAPVSRARARAPTTSAITKDTAARSQILDILPLPRSSPSGQAWRTV